MKDDIDRRDKVGNSTCPVEHGYDAWKRAKVEHGLAQARDRASLMPIGEVLRDLGFAR